MSQTGLTTYQEFIRRVFGTDLDWTRHDAGTFSIEDEELLARLGNEHDVHPTLIRKLLDLELSMDGLSRRRGIPARIRSVLNEEWQPLNVVLERGEHIRDGGYQEEIDRLQKEIVTFDKGTHECS